MKYVVILFVLILTACIEVETVHTLRLPMVARGVPSVSGVITFAGEAPPCIISVCEIKYTKDGYRYCSYDPHNNWLRGWRVYADSDGAFAVWNVDDGEYALVLDVVTVSVIPNWPDTSEPVIFDVTSAGVWLELRYEDAWPW